MERKNDRIPIFTERFRKLQGDRSNTEFAEFLEISRQTVGFYCNGDRVPDALTLIKIAEKCNVSADWLLGLSELRTTGGELAKACNYTGLSEEAVEGLHWIAIFSEGNRNNVVANLIEMIATDQDTFAKLRSKAALASMKAKESGDERTFIYEMYRDAFKAGGAYSPEGMICVSAKDAAQMYIETACNHISNLARTVAYKNIECTEDFESDFGDKK